MGGRTATASARCLELHEHPSLLYGSACLRGLSEIKQRIADDECRSEHVDQISLSIFHFFSGDRLADDAVAHAAVHVDVAARGEKLDLILPHNDA